MPERVNIKISFICTEIISVFSYACMCSGKRRDARKMICDVYMC